MSTTDEYVALIEPQHANKPQFVATVALTADVLARLQVLIASIPREFDLDYAVGVQLDAVGVRVGRSRLLPYPLLGLWFTWGDAQRGWGRGLWRGPYDAGVGISQLDDETYRRLLRAKILANSWDGSSAGQNAILSAYFIDPETHVFVEDDGLAVVPENYFTWGDALRGWGAGVWKTDDLSDPLAVVNMRMTIVVSGKLPTTLDLELLAEDLVAANPAGVELKYAVTSVDGAPVFGWGVNNEYIGGWGSGAWAVTPEYAIDNLPAAA